MASPPVRRMRAKNTLLRKRPPSAQKGAEERLSPDSPSV
jgi:hypothetical protein